LREESFVFLACRAGAPAKAGYLLFAVFPRQIEQKAAKGTKQNIRALTAGSADSFFVFFVIFCLQSSLGKIEQKAAEVTKQNIRD
jgi:alanine-alpha-ketoisovalerate/valine-pyruvate aminotransferase